MPKPIPLLFLSDNPTLPTGLGRITKDLAIIASSLPQFRVGVLGRGGSSSSQFPFVVYPYPEERQWGQDDIQLVWSDFAGGDRGVLFSINDVSRMGWLVMPVGIDGGLGEFLRNKPFDTWLYTPVDGFGIGGKLTSQCRDTLPSFTRLLAYTIYGKQVLESTIGKEVDWIPHGFNPNKFQPRNEVQGRALLGVGMYDVMVGCVMTNQIRKDWGTAFGAIARLKEKLPNLKMWAHTDVISRHWNLFALREDFGLQKSVMITQTGDFNSEQLSYLYSACDLTILPSLGEGFGFPIVESLACGVPVVHGNCGGGVELVPDKEWLVQPVAERLESTWNVVRPVWSPNDWADKMEAVLGSKPSAEFCTGAVSHLTWKNLGPVWKRWMLAGIGIGQ